MRRPVITCAIALALCTVTGAIDAAASAGAATPALALTRVAALEGVTAMAARPGTRTLYVTQQSGVVRAIRNGKRLAAPVVDLTGRVSQDDGERGLLGLAFSPDGSHLYVDYTGTDGNTRIDQLTMNGRNAEPSSRNTVLAVEQPQANHNGGQLAFGPDGYLYIGLGDGGAAGDGGAGHAAGGNAQSLDTLLGKILRIAPNVSPAGAPYSAPPENPFVGRTGARPEIWAYGLRNPWRFSFDRATGDLWIGDVGEHRWEEIDHAPATHGRDAARGDNFGWNRLEGTHAFRGAVPADAIAPVFEVSHDAGACAIVGGYVYRGGKIPGLEGTYLFSDNCDGTIRLLESDRAGGATMRDSGLRASSVSSFGQGNGGALYVLSLADGVFRIDAARG
jgi:glucose/arabinose dehydrogenase